MKRFLIVLTVFALLLGLCACGKTGETYDRFESEDAFLQQLEGLWVVEDSQKYKTYFAFTDGTVFCTSDFLMTGRIQDHIYDTVYANGLAAFQKLDYASCLSSITPKVLMGGALSDVRIEFKNGRILLSEGTALEQHIFIKDGIVQVKNKADNTVFPLTKICDSLDLSGEPFVRIFENAKVECTVPTKHFWTSAEDYGEMIISLNPDVRSWDLITKNSAKTVYQSSKWVSSISGSLTITETGVTYSNKVYLGDFDYLGEWSPEFSVLYTPGVNIIVVDDDNLSVNMSELILYAAKAFDRFPGAARFLTVERLVEKEFAAKNFTVENGGAKVELTINGIHYTVIQGTNGTWGYVSATADENIKLSDLVDYSQTETPPPSQTQTSPPQTTPAQPQPTNDVPYTTPLSGSVSIYSGPSYDHSFVQSVGQDGVFTIVEEAYDSEGNLWGKLKSGLGWVNLVPAEEKQASQNPITAKFADSNLRGDYHKVVVDDSEYMVKVVFSANEKLSNVQFTSLTFADDGYAVSEVYQTLPELTPGKPLVACVSFPGIMSVYGISFTDSSGNHRSFAVSTSGRDGSLVFEEY